MAAETHDFDLAGLRLSAGEGRRLELDVRIEPLMLGSERYEVRPERVPVELERLAHDRRRLRAAGCASKPRCRGPCMRCLEPACPAVAVEAREVDRPGGGDELDSPYVSGETLDLAGWARDAFALAMPAKVLCRDDCAGLCPVCAANLNEAGPEHRHEPAPDPRWAKLRELELE